MDSIEELIDQIEENPTPEVVNAAIVGLMKSLKVQQDINAQLAKGIQEQQALNNRLAEAIDRQHQLNTRQHELNRTVGEGLTALLSDRK